METPRCVIILPTTAEWLSSLGMGFFAVEEPCERMAGVVFFLRALDEEVPGSFPHGKWATIQSIEEQLAAWGRSKAEPLNVAGRLR